jgi:hypothetical protein
VRAKGATAAMLFQVLSLHCHNDRERFQFFLGTFRELLLTPGLPLLDAHFGWEWHEVAKKLIDASADADWFTRFAHFILGVLKSEETYIGTDYLRKATVAIFRKAPTVTWGPFADALADRDSPNHYVIVEFLSGGGHGFYEDGGGECPIWEIPLPQFRSWIEAHRDLAPLLLDRLQLYTVEKDESKKQRFHWHHHALLLIEITEDEDEAMREVLGNLWSFGSTGSRVPYWERRQALVSDLAAMANPKFQRIARELDAEVLKVIEHTKREEMNEQARFS